MEMLGKLFYTFLLLGIIGILPRLFSVKLNKEARELIFVCNLGILAGLIGTTLTLIWSL